MIAEPTVMTTDDLIRLALDPRRSVVVEACAGSGKTWLLASRILRLLLAGTAPSEILAITFTRKAAREIEERVRGWLRDMAVADDAALGRFLAERAIPLADQSPALRDKARGLYEAVLAAEPGLSVHTFHGWFLQLAASAPLTAGCAGVSLADAPARLLAEVWEEFAEAQGAAPDTPVALAFLRLLAEQGGAGAYALMTDLASRRAEWMTLVGEDEPDEAAAPENGADGLDPATAAPAAAARALNALLPALGDGSAPTAADAYAALFPPGWELEWQALLGALEVGTGKEQDQAAVLRQALAEADPAHRFALLCAMSLTKEGSPLARKPSAASAKRLGSEAAAEAFVARHQRLCGELLACRARLANAACYAFNGDAALVGAAFLAALDRHKAARGVIDFVDAEWRVAKLLADDTQAAFLQARLDARYRHILLDEFQDTNPLQWAILRGWLAAYPEGEAAPQVFLVGDPKQSIYRFRRAEPRLFAAAADFLEHNFHAVRLAQDRTRRNAKAIIDGVNALFAAEPLFTPFRPQESLAGDLPGRIELLPLVADDGDDAAAAAGEGGGAELPHLRDPLREPEVEAEDSRREREAALVAATIARAVGRWAVHPQGAGGPVRPARCGDFLILSRTRRGFAPVEAALRAAGIPYLAASRGGLLGTLEARDLAALIAFLVLPADDLALAQVLRSPLFDFTDADLLAVSRAGGGPWWARLKRLVAGSADAVDSSPEFAAAPTPAEAAALARRRRAVDLLRRWRRAALELPAHDLLDRVFHEGEVLARYRASLGEAAYGAVAANLQAVLQLALDQGGGRYPSLPRFLDALRELADADPEEAPDEGELDDTNGAGGNGSDGGRVRLLTVHAAKGLEAPFVWLVDANAPGGGRHDTVGWAVEWPPEAEAPAWLAAWRSEDRKQSALSAWFDQEKALAEREALNLLYVAITRARQGFFASGIVPKRAVNAPTPYGRIAGALGRLGALAEDADPGQGAAYGAALEMAQDGDFQASIAEPRVPIGSPGDASGEARPAGPSVAPLPVAPIGERRAEQGEAERYGTALHAALEALSDGLPLPESADPLLARAHAAGAKLFAHPDLAPFFDPARYKRAWNELEMGLPDGSVLRADRVVETEEAVWVVDYKSGTADTPRLADYRAQVRGYCTTLAALFPLPVRGALIFADASVVEV